MDIQFLPCGFMSMFLRFDGYVLFFCMTQIYCKDSHLILISLYLDCNTDCHIYQLVSLDQLFDFSKVLVFSLLECCLLLRT